jgi:hypothetical protein
VATKTKHEESFPVRLVFFQEGRRWVAQCVDFDINASGATIPEATEQFFWTFVGEIVVRAELGKLDPRNLKKSLPKARPHFEDWFKNAEPLVEKRFTMPPGTGLPEAHVIRAVRADRRLFE